MIYLLIKWGAVIIIYTNPALTFKYYKTILYVFIYNNTRIK